MKPWNPYAMTFHGQPIVGQTPPKLVVYGPPLTAQQGAMLQTAYNAFVGAARVSIVPNPTRQGRLLDGSPYTIECSQGVCTCTVWTVAAGDRLPDAFSGILFTPPGGAFALINEGSVGEPSAKWIQKSLKDFPLSLPQLPGARPAYNNAAYVCPSSTIPGAVRYTYRNGLLGRYGNVVGGTFGADEIVGVSENADAFILVGGSSGRVTAAYSTGVTPGSAVPPFGAPIGSSVVVARDPSSEVVIYESSPDPQNGQLVPNTASINRSGRRVMYVVRTESFPATSGDVVDGMAKIKYSHSQRGGYNPKTGELYTTYTSRGTTEIKFWMSEDEVWEANRTHAGRTDCTKAPIYTVPQNEISAATKVSATFVPGRGIVPIGSGNVTGVNVTEKTTTMPSHTTRLVTFEGGYWQLRGDMTKAGPIGGRFSRKEKLYSVYPHYVGNARVLLPLCTELDYVESCVGYMSLAVIDGYWDEGYSGELPQQPDIVAIASGPTSPKQTLVEVSQAVTVRLRQDTYFILNDGRKFYTAREGLDEVCDVSMNDSIIWVASPPVTTLVRDGHSDYTITREIRQLCAYDPELSLLCYVECVFSTTRSANYGYRATTEPPSAVWTNSAGGGLPPPPSVELVIECRGTKRTFQLAYDTRENQMLGFFPPVGASPLAVENEGLKTSGGIAIWDVTTDFDSPRGLKYAVAGDWTPLEPLGEKNLSALRGIAPPALGMPAVAVKYIKTPETGAAYMHVDASVGTTKYVDKAFLIDSAGVRDLEDVFPDHPQDVKATGVF